ncbi:hypothetical protein [Acinetobacter sp.]|uniref:hypothetical protein n=1 Tax=Acinetobacter sp. TaxID=472 RepID=UPI003CFFC72C
MNIHNLAKMIHERLKENMDGEFDEFYVILGALSDWKTMNEIASERLDMFKWLEIKRFTRAMSTKYHSNEFVLVSSPTEIKIYVKGTEDEIVLKL